MLDKLFKLDFFFPYKSCVFIYLCVDWLIQCKMIWRLEKWEYYWWHHKQTDAFSWFKLSYIASFQECVTNWWIYFWTTIPKMLHLVFFQYIYMKSGFLGSMVHSEFATGLSDTLLFFDYTCVSFFIRKFITSRHFFY